MSLCGHTFHWWYGDAECDRPTHLDFWYWVCVASWIFFDTFEVIRAAFG